MWTSGVRSHADPYGAFWVDGGTVGAHAWIYERVVGPVPAGAIVMHSCDNPRCVALQHLSIGTKLLNNRDRHDKGRDAIGERAPCVKLTDDEVDVIRARYAAGGVTMVRLGLEYGVSGHQIGNIVSNKSRRRRTNRRQP